MYDICYWSNDRCRRCFSRFLEVDSNTGLIIAAIVVLFYAVLGGMKGITYTQVAQYCVLMVAYIIPAIFISLNLTGNPVPQLGMFGNDVSTGMPILQKLDMLVADLGFAQYTADVPNKLNMFLLTMSLMIGTAGLPHVIIRFFTVPKVSDARISAGWTLIFIALLYTTAPAVGSMARLNIINTVYPQGLNQPALAYEARPEWMKNWETTGLLKYEDKNNDGLIQYYNDKNKEYATTVTAEKGWQGNELTVNNDILVLANPEIANLPSWVIGLIAAGGLAAALSTAAGLLLAISSAISHDLIKKTIKPDINDKGELMAARISMTIAIVVATYLGMNPPGFTAQVVAVAFGIAASSLFPALMMGIFSKRINSTGATAGMIAGLSATCIYVFLYMGWFFIPGTNSFENVEANWILGVSPLSFGAIGAVINFIVAIAVSAMGNPPPKEVQDLVESVRYPKGAGGAINH